MGDASLIASYIAGVFTMAGWMMVLSHLPLERRMNLSAILPHYLLRVDATEVILANDRDDQCAPSWVLRLLVSTRDLEVAVDIRVETPVCGFSLAEYARSSAKSILLRTSVGPLLGDNPWNGSPP